MGIEERRKREREQRKKDILDAARTLLFEQGIQATSVNAIAKKSELSIGTIYFYFKNKEEIYAALQEEGLETLYSMVTFEKKKKSSPEDRLLNSAMAYLDFSRQHKNYFDVINFFITSPGTYFGSDLMTRIHSKGSSILAYIEAIIKEGKQKDTFNETSPDRYAIFFWASLHGLILMKKMQENTILENEDYDSFFTYSVEKLINSIKIN